jgi:spore maturation protein A
MMSGIFSMMIAIGIVLGGLTGRMAQVSTAVLSESAHAVELALTLMGNFCLWGGVMCIAEEAGLSKSIARVASPIVRRLFAAFRRRRGDGRLYDDLAPTCWA